mmetsp:Transcript_26483/g.57387  ORF Transcript_26483/g.57387 Transcript_26483/m.57387 type:complete len:999 (-) Transcript_26483:48-3044(-)
MSPSRYDQLQPGPSSGQPIVRSVFTCPSVTSFPGSYSSNVRSAPSVIAVPARESLKHSACRLVATHDGRKCNLITHSPMPGGSDDGEISSAEPQPVKVARCRISFDKDLGAVALAIPGRKNEDINNDDSVDNAGPILFVADVVGRLWRSKSCKTSALAYSEGHIDTKADNGDAVGDNGPFEMIECSGKTISGRKVRRCLPLGVDLMSIRPRMGRPNETATDGTFLVAAGSQSIHPPAIVYVPNDITANVLVEEVAGTEASQIVSVLFVSRGSVGNAWKRLLSGHHHHSMLGASPGFVSQADAAVLFGMSDGSIYCALVSSVYANDEGKQVTSFNIEPAVPIARLHPQQSIVSLFLAPKGTSSTCCQSPDSLLVCVGCLGTVAVLDWTSTESSSSVFVSTSGALPRMNTWTSAAPFQSYHSTNSDTSIDRLGSRGGVTFAILATCDDGSTYTRQLTLKKSNGYCKLIAMQTARRLAIRKDVASASTLCVPNNNTNNVDGIYLFTFKGSLLGLHVVEENTILRAAAKGKSSASDCAVVSLKRLCEASLDTRVGPLRKVGTNENVVNAMTETRNAERIMSLNPENSSLGNDSGADSAQVKRNWFRTSHFHQSMLADAIASQKGLGKDLAPLFFEENGDRAKRTKVTYSGATRNHCSYLDNSGDHGYMQEASLWNRRAFFVNASLTITFEQSIDAGILMMHHGERISNGRKRKIVPSLMPVGLAGSARSMQNCIGKRKQFSNGERDVFGLVAPAKIDLPARWSTLDDVVSGMLENDSPTSRETVGRNVGGVYLANTERSMIKGDSAVRTGKNACSTRMANQSIFLSTDSAIAKRLSREGSNSDGITLTGKRMYGIDSVSLAVEAQQSNDSCRNLRYSVETSNAGTKEYVFSVCSTLPLLRSCIVGMLARRLEAPGHQASFPDLSELEAANLLDSYHQAVKNPRTKKMARYLATKAGECLAALKSDGEDDANNNGKGSSLLLVDTAAVMTLYNQLRAIPLPLG